MKIRRTDNTNIVVERDLGKNEWNGGYFWHWDEILKIHTHYTFLDWEEVPDEPELVDVTGKCDVLSGHLRNVLNRNDGGQRSILPEGYEWRKVKAYVIPDVDEFYQRLPNGDAPEFWRVLAEYKQSCLQIWGPK